MPEVYDVVTWASPHLRFEQGAPNGTQPHLLGGPLARSLGLAGRDPWNETAPPSAWSAIGRNGPEVRHLVLANTDEQAVMFRDHVYQPIRWYNRAELVPHDSWSNLAFSTHSRSGVNLCDIISLGDKPWLACFEKTLRRADDEGTS